MIVIDISVWLVLLSFMFSSCSYLSFCRPEASFPSFSPNFLSFPAVLSFRSFDLLKEVVVSLRFIRMTAWLSLLSLLVLFIRCRSIVSSKFCDSTAFRGWEEEEFKKASMTSEGETFFLFFFSLLQLLLFFFFLRSRNARQHTSYTHTYRFTASSSYIAPYVYPHISYIDTWRPSSSFLSFCLWNLFLSVAGSGDCLRKRAELS